MSYFKKIFFLITVYFFSYSYLFAIDFKPFYKDKISKEDIYWFGEKTVIDSVSTGNWLSTLDNILKYFKNSIFDLLALLVIWAFVYIWAKLVVARWNPEEFKKALTYFIYIIVWIFLVSSAWAIVKLVSWLNF